MLEVYEPGAAIIEDSVANAVGRLTKSNKCALDFASRAQKAMLEEMIFASNEIFDRIRTETTCSANLPRKWPARIRSGT